MKYGMQLHLPANARTQECRINTHYEKLQPPNATIDNICYKMLILITARLIIHNFNQREVEFQELELLTEDETKHEHRAPGKLTKK